MGAGNLGHQQVDGLRYHSRHDDTRLCCGLFDRTRSLLSEENMGSGRAPERTILPDYYDYGFAGGE